jgi:hypothetical protein
MQTVHVVFKTHLDVGFTDFAGEVVSLYFGRYIPAALDLAEALRQRGGSERFVWTTGSWLVYEYLEQASPPERQRMERAIENGDMVWHALPFTTHTELMDPGLFRFGLSLSHTLDERFGRHTIACKMTDVPGHTRSMIPYLAEAGIRFLHIGVNGASSPPSVPPAFVWRAPDGCEIVVLYSAGGYGTEHVLEGMEDVLLFAHSGDNLGPPSVDQVLSIFQDARQRFPGAAVVASTMDRYAAALLAIQSTLPVITSEIGDTWIHGTGSDPKKVAQFRELQRARAAWIKRGIAEASLEPFSRRLLLVPEHTWGLDVKTHLGDFTHYATLDFARARAQDRVDPSAAPPAQADAAQLFAIWSRGREGSYRRLEASWQEQRDYITQAVAALPTDELSREAQARLQDLEPREPSRDGFSPFDPSRTLDSPWYRVAFDSTTGCLSLLIDKVRNRTWCSAGQIMGLFRYQSFSQADYDRWLSGYVVNLEQTRDWAIPDFSKPGMDAAVPKPERRTYLPELTGSWARHADKELDVILELRMPVSCSETLGAPKRLTIAYRFQEQAVDMRLQWFEKQACRLPEAAWFSFAPAVREPKRWMLDKMGGLVSPLDVVPDGNRNLHAVDRGMVYQDEESYLRIESLDAPLVAPWMRRLLHFDRSDPPLDRGMHFNLHNNVWGTNFRMWYEDDALFRFRVWLAPGDEL